MLLQNGFVMFWLTNYDNCHYSKTDTDYDEDQDDP